VFGGTLPAAIWQKFMTEAHDGVPVAQLPGAELAPALAAAAAAPAARQMARATSGEQVENEARMRDWILNRGRDGERRVRRQQRAERVGIMRRVRRLFD